MKRRSVRPWLGFPLLAALVALAGCSGGEENGTGGRPGGGGGPGARPAGGRGGPGGAPAAAVPVEVAPVERRDISAYIETNGTLEAENEVDIVARVAAPLVALEAEEGDAVAAGRLLARLDDIELRAQLEISRVALDEARQIHERAQRLFEERLISPEEFEAASSGFDSARAQSEANQILLGYTEIRAPFRGLIVARYVDNAEQVAANQALFRISDFDPLLCPIQIPERDLSRLRVGQPAWLEVESWPGQRFPASVLRISPVVDAATGTIKVTLDATSPNSRLRPGMFARVFLEAETRTDALVIPRSALSLESIGDVVYVAQDGKASRREVTLGFEEGVSVEVQSGVAQGELVVVVGQDGLSDGTPVQPLGDGAPARTADRRPSGTPDPAAEGPARAAAMESGETAASGSPGSPQGPAGRGRGLDPSTMTAEQLDQLKERMRARGLTEAQIEERLERMRERAAQNGE